MLQNEVDRAEESLSQIRRASSITYRFFNILFITCSVIWLVVSASSFIFKLAPHSFATVKMEYFEIATLSFTGFLVLVLLRIITNVFRDVARGMTPFTLVQVKRIRLAALMIALDAFVGMIFSPGFVHALQIAGLDIGYAVSGQPSIPVDLGEILAALCLIALSFVFKYGVLLQEFSDETL